jgi:hypothetical protein
MGLTLRDTGVIVAIFSPEAASVGALADPGTCFETGGLAIGYIDLECTNASPGRFKTAGSSTNIIENEVSGTSRISIFGSGGGGGGSGLTSKVVNSSRGDPDGSVTQNATITTVSNKTRVTISGYTYVTAVNPGKVKGDLEVFFNGQIVERKVTGVNDTEGNVIYEEVSGSIVDIYSITGGVPAALTPGLPIDIFLVQYTVQDLTNVASHILPAITENYDLGSASRKWRDLYLSGSSIHMGTGILRQNSTTEELEFKKNPSSSFSPIGSGGAGGDILANLTADELNQTFAIEPNTIQDAFQENTFGTKVNMAATNSALRFSAGQTSGSYERKKSTTTQVTNARGVSVESRQYLRPKNTTIAANTIKFTGDVSAFFPTSKNVVIFTELPSNDALADGKRRHIFLTDLVGNIAQLNVNSSSYSSGPDETTIILDNPDSLDLSMGLSNTVYNDKLRVEPFDRSYQVKANAVDTYETCDLEDAHIDESFGNPVSRIPGQDYLRLIGSLTGSIAKTDLSVSKNGLYGIIRVLEKSSSAPYNWHWFYSVDSLKTWTKFSTTKSVNSANTAAAVNLEENGGNWHISHPNQLCIADNGKMFSIYAVNNASTNNSIYGVYSDLSSPTPTLSDTPTNAGTGIGNNTGVGIIASSTVAEFVGIAVACDPVDASWIAVVIADTSDAGSVAWYSSGGSVKAPVEAVGTYSMARQLPTAVFVLGTGSSHRTIITRSRPASSNNLYSVVFDQSSGSVVSDTDLGTATTRAIVGYDINAAKNLIAVLHTDNTTGGSTRWFTLGNLLTTPAIAENGLLFSSSSGLTADLYVGWSSVNATNFFKTLDRRVRFNPADDKHIFLGLDVNHPDESGFAARPTLIEIRDRTNYVGEAISQYSENTSYPLNSLSSNQKISQTVTFSSTRLRTIALKVRQVGYVPAGSVLSLTVNTTSGGAPTNTVQATALNTYDAAGITKDSSGQWIFFNFDTATLTGVYSLVLSTTGSTDASNYIAFHGSSANPYAGGDLYNYNGTTWSVSTGNDTVFVVNSEWIYEMGIGYSDTSTSYTGARNPTQESQFSFIDSSSLNFVYRKRSNIHSDSYRPITGIPFRRTVSIGTGTAASTLTARQVAGYAPANFDENLVFNTSLGSSLCERITNTTGVGTGLKAEDASGFSSEIGTGSNGTGYVNITAGNFVADSDFESGFCCTFNGTDQYLSYLASPLRNMSVGPDYNADYILEAEIKWNGTTGAFRTICSPFDGVSGWRFGINSAGFLALTMEGVDTIANDAVESTSYHKVRAIFTKSDNKWRLYRTTSVPHTSFTEVASYSAQPVYGTATYGTSQFSVGGTSSYFGGKIGYIKFSRRSSSFVYTGFKPQHALVGLQVEGKTVLTEKQVSGFWENTGGYDQWGLIDPTPNLSAFGDCYDHSFRWKKQLSIPGKTIHVKSLHGRGTTLDSSAEQGMIFKFDK